VFVEGAPFVRYSLPSHSAYLWFRYFSGDQAL